jgi:hypothetical protein
MKKYPTGRFLFLMQLSLKSLLSLVRLIQTYLPEGMSAIARKKYLANYNVSNNRHFTVLQAITGRPSTGLAMIVVSFHETSQITDQHDTTN